MSPIIVVSVIQCAVFRAKSAKSAMIINYYNGLVAVFLPEKYFFFNLCKSMNRGQVGAIY